MMEEQWALINDLSQFTYQSYRKLLNYLSKKYRITSFSNIEETKKPYLILRHDIDASPIEAIKMAKIENSMGVKSTYFVLLSHKLYNIFFPENYKALKTILKLGHEIGLHYDLSAYDNYKVDYYQNLDTEVNILGKLLNTKISCISVHNPSINQKTDPFVNYSKYTNAYDKRLYELYVSDSCRSWYVDDLYKLLSSEREKNQLAIHPFLWTEKKIIREKLIQTLFNKNRTQNEVYEKDWINLWKTNDKVLEYEKRLLQLG